jgi:hypothetical protein
LLSSAFARAIKAVRDSLLLICFSFFLYEK